MNQMGYWHEALTKKLKDMRKSYKDDGILVKSIVMEDISELENILTKFKSTVANDSEVPQRPKSKSKSAGKKSSKASLENVDLTGNNNVPNAGTHNKTSKNSKSDSDSDYSPMDDYMLNAPVTRGRGIGSRRGRGGRGSRRSRGGKTKRKSIKLWLPKDPHERAAILKANPELLYS